MQTICRDCIFGIKDGINQVDCKIATYTYDRYDGKFDIQKATDGNSEFLVVKDWMCQYSRTPKWLEYHKYDMSDIQALKTRIEEEVLFGYDAIIYVDKLDNESLSRSLHHISSLKHQPRKTIVLLNGDVFMKDVEHVVINHTFPWELCKVFAKNEDGSNLDKYAAIDTVEPKLEAMFYISCNAGILIPDVHELVYDKIFNHLTKFVYEKTDQYEIINLILRQRFRGDIITQCELLAKESTST